MTNLEQNAFMVGDWLVEPQLNRLTRGEDVQQIEPKSMDVLLHLCRHSNKVVGNDELIAAVWGGRPMGDNPVYKAIAKLRKAFGDESGEPRFIETVSRKGYRLIAEVRIAEVGGSASTKPAEKFALRQWLPVAVGMLAGVLLAAVIFWKPAAESPVLRPLSNFPGSHIQPSLSPDAGAIAFASNLDGESHIWVLDRDAQAPRKVSRGDGYDYRPRWSPDGATILFARGRNLWTVPVIGGDEREVIRNAYNPNWSRDGKRIVFERAYEVWIADASGEQQMRVAGIPRVELALAPRWPAFSPDGSEIVFLDAGTTPFADLWRVQVDGGEPVQMTFDPAIASAPVWSPDGKYVYYSTHRGGSRTLWRVNVAGNTAEAVLAGSGDDDFPDVSADGTQLVYSNTREHFTLLESNPVNGEERVLHESRQMVLAPEISPEGSRIAYFAAARSGGMQVFSLPVDGGAPSQLTTDPLAAHAIPRWSADGRDVYFYLTGASTAYAKVNVLSGDVSTVVPGWDWFNAHGASVSPDGTRIVYSRLNGQVPVETLIREIDSNTDNMFPAALEYPRWSSDGTRIAGSLHKDQRFPGDVSICHADGSGCRLVANDARIPVWSADQTKLYYVRRFGASQELFMQSIDEAGGEQKILEMGPLHLLGPFYAVTNDGNIVWVRYDKDPGEIWMADLPQI
jgi:Tol biopolymer transport system component/DNA-binding winged helix-turn-helix (wHTH) protein